jgi:hypothetical protein
VRDKAQPKTCAACGGYVSQPALKFGVGPFEFCSVQCRNKGVPAELRKLRAAVLDALRFVRNERARKTLQTGLLGEYTAPELEGVR